MSQEARPLPRRPGVTAKSSDPTTWPSAVDGKPQPRITSDVMPTAINETTEPGQKPETEYRTPKRTGLVALPSRGLFYGDALTDGQVEVYTLTAVEDKILSELNSENMVEIFDAILARCIKSPVSPPDMLDTDRYYLLLVLRANSLGEIYEFPYECPFCKHNFLHSIKIPQDFSMITGKVTEEPYYVKLSTGVMVGLRFLRGKDMKDIVQFRKNAINLDGTKGDPAYAYARVKSIMTVDGKPFPDVQAAQEWYMALSIKDSRLLEKTQREAASGVSNVVKIACPKCSKESVTPVALSPMYFFD